MKVLFVADIVGSCGMDIAEKYIRRLKKRRKNRFRHRKRRKCCPQKRHQPRIVPPPYLCRLRLRNIRQSQL